MKFTAATIAAVMATGALAKPRFTNNMINPEEGKPFTLMFDGCTGGCTIILQSGPNSLELSDIRTLTTDANGGSFDVTLSDLGSGAYNFRISNNVDGSEPNYSATFSYIGTGATPEFPSRQSLSPSSSSGSATDLTPTSSPDEASTTRVGAPSSTDSTSSTSSTSVPDSDKSDNLDNSGSSGNSSDSSNSDRPSSSRPSALQTETDSATTPTATHNVGSVAGFSPLGLLSAAAAALFL
ncbi:hypothetical protein V2A60_000171 [Cordyceps javanica]|uniref:Ser-Thr-rich glycosyl-phosphatidyl-inositol-anchored membrane family domain-containing protein n=1 Tax=Cordyceps javanica TaxID=43265 RepID=A0A545V665_9HYPO|nr:ser-Thr-rich glycosyl-phosphatidyl-inositol-anchored membrane family domain-containing protein [Cordyceps javanica]TQW08448.1 ser-Thr-rich glycosyl-phosphatidyl-inositol-anchored membrane family domain-containing protein [Cordyceps javanica]